MKVIETDEFNNQIESLKNDYGSARISIRKSGTEPKIRVMVESDSKEDVANIVNCVEKLIV
jgi:Phosphomannomutase